MNLNKISILMGEMFLEFGQLNISYGKWIKAKIAGSQHTEEKFDIEDKKTNIIHRYLQKCEQENILKKDFLDICITTDFENRRLYHNMEELDTVINDKARQIAITVISENSTAGLNDLLRKSMNINKGTISAKIMKAELQKQLKIEKLALEKTVEELSKGDSRISIKLDNFLKDIEKQIADIEERLKK